MQGSSASVAAPFNPPCILVRSTTGIGLRSTTQYYGAPRVGWLLVWASLKLQAIKEAKVSESTANLHLRHCLTPSAGGLVHI